MSYSRRQLEALGEPLGESVTRKEGGRIVYGSGGGGGGSGTQTTVTDVPEWAKSAAQNVLARGETLSQRDYTPYGGERIAGFKPLQQQAFGAAQQLGPSAVGQAGIGLAGSAAFGALGAGGRFDPYQTGQFGAQAGQYMDPYMQNVVGIQQREAQRQADIEGTQRGAQAVSKGAFGGSRQAIMDAEAARNLATQKGDIQARGLQDAYGRGQQQFNTEQQLREQSRQYGAGLGMQGFQTALQGAGQLGALGQQQFGQQKEAIGLQSQLGGQQQALDQQRMSQQYQDFLNQQRHPYQQLEFMSGLIRGTPMGTVQSMYAAQPTMAQNIGALGMGAYGIGQLMRAEGGTVSSYAEGGSVTDDQNVDNILDKLSDTQLHQARDMAMSRQDAAQVSQIDQELAQRASIRSGLGNAFNAIPQERQEQMMAGGGMVAFRDRGFVDADTSDTDVVTDRIPVGRGDERIYGQSMAGLTALQAKMAGDTGYSPLTAAEEKAMYDRSTSRGKEIYGGLLDKIKADIATQRGESAESLREGRGLAALQAAAAMTQGRGLVQGLGRAGGAFAGAYGQALRSDKEQKRALSAMDLNLAKAESEQLMGLHNKAEAQITKANANREKAHAAGVNRDKAMADILYKSGRLALPPAPTKTGGGPKLSPDERIADKFEAIASGKAKYMGATGPDAANAYMENISRTGAARTGVRYTGPDKTFDRQVNLQKLYADDPRLKELAASLSLAHLNGNAAKIASLNTAIADREKALAATLPTVPGAPKPGPGGPTAQPTVPTLEQFMTAARAAPANKGVSDADLRAYYQSTYGRK